MSLFVLDASVTLSWIFEDEFTAATDSLLQSLHDGEAEAPAIWAYEVGNVVAMAVRRGKLSSEQARSQLKSIGRLRIAVHPPVRMEIWGAILDMAGLHRLTVYDAAYLHLAIQRSLPLATRDRALARACIEAGVPVLGGDP